MPIKVTADLRLKKPTPVMLKGEQVTVFHHEKASTYCVVLNQNGEPITAALCDLDLVGKEKPQPIKKFSETRAKENKIYLTLRKVFLESHPNCEANLPGCKKVADQVHHSGGRIGKRLIDISLFMAFCGNCHTWVNEHPESALEMGLAVNRL